MPPRGGDPSLCIEVAKKVADKVHALNITDGSRAIMRMCSLAMSKLLLENNIEPIMQISCRDRNLIGLQSDLLGANALGIKNILCITGDPVRIGDQPKVKPVHEYESVKLIKQIQDFNLGLDPCKGNLIDGKTELYVGAAADPNSAKPEILYKRILKKKEAGAKFLQTQMIMDANILERFCKDISDPIGIPVLAGVFLLKSYKNAIFINKFVPGANIPNSILSRLEKAKNPFKEGLKIASEQIEEFLSISKGVHIMAVKAEQYIPEIIENAKINLDS